MCMKRFPRVLLAFLSRARFKSPPSKTQTHTTSTPSIQCPPPHAPEESKSRSVAQRDVIPRKHSCLSAPETTRGVRPLLTLLLLLGRVLHPEWPRRRGASGSPAAPQARPAPYLGLSSPWGRRALCWPVASPTCGAGGVAQGSGFCLFCPLGVAGFVLLCPHHLCVSAFDDRYIPVLHVFLDFSRPSV